MGKTEGVFNLMAHRLDQGPYSPVLYIGPTEKFTKSIASDRWKKLLATTPKLWQKTAKGHAYKTTEQFIGGVRCGWAWAGSASEIAGHPAGMVMVDERSRMSSDVGGEGDPVSLARARTKNYPQRKIGIFSTPTIEDADPTWSLMEEGAINLWAWPCAHCGEVFVPTLALFHWPREVQVTEAMRAARVACPHCGAEHDDSHKAALNAAGRFAPHRLKTDKESQTDAVLGRYIAIKDQIEHPSVGYWISGLASAWASLADTAQVLIAAYQSADQEKIQAEINTWGGELYRVRGEAPEWNEVAACSQAYKRGQIQPGILFLTLGADVQKNGVYYVVRGWGYNMESWLIDEGFVPGDTQFDEVWLRCGDIIQGEYGDMRIRRAFIDSGYRPGDVHRRPDHAVYTFSRRFQGLVFPTRGQSTQERPVRFSALDYTLGGKQIKAGVKLFNIDTDYFKRWVYARINWPREEPGAWHIHEDYSEDYCRQVVSEEHKIWPSGKHTWIKRIRDNHYLDCEVLATAAALVEGADKIPAAPKKVAEIPRNETAGSPRQPRGSFSRRSLL